MEQAEKLVNKVKSPYSQKRLSVEAVGNELECPVCFVDMADMNPPIRIWQCAQGHLVCETCKSNYYRFCPTCRQNLVGRATTVEKIALRMFSEREWNIQEEPILIE